MNLGDKGSVGERKHVVLRRPSCYVGKANNAGSHCGEVAQAARYCETPGGKTATWLWGMTDMQQQLIVKMEGMLPCKDERETTVRGSRYHVGKTKASSHDVVKVAQRGRLTSSIQCRTNGVNSARSTKKSVSECGKTDIACHSMVRANISKCEQRWRSP